ncbi:MAG: PSD1 and planctomycete cytochrome C domain-containing protein, partial [Pirellulaceae bacterium]|nr:PSD1 and planctomycete cytochrome C domain-containing protein [Pirellulaceae bacterium]
MLLDTRESTRKGGESGHAVVPGNLKESLLINALRFEDFEMPPDEPLPESVIADFEKWIKLGAPDPREGKMPVVRKELDIEKAREFWSFSPIRKSSPPKIEKKSWPRTDIDRFVLARLESKGLEPNMDADPRVLVRRVYFDLIGLPPTPEQVNEFIGDPSAAALEQLIDRLLDSPQFGARWGRHWLDVVRYGESTGMERNFTFPYAWRYRDYVIQSLNKDKPFDRFIAEQVAGDLLPADNNDQRNEQLIATGVLAIGTKSLNETNREKFVMDVVDEQIDVTTQAFMAFTVSCARCHDHKFDPIPNEDYYSLAGIFRSTETFYGTGKLNGNRQQGKLLALGPKDVKPVATGGATGRKGNTTKKLANQLKAAQRRLQQLRKQASKNDAAAKRATNAEAQVKKLQAQIRKSKRDAEAQTAKPDPATTVLVMAVQDAADPSDTALRIRGEANERGDTIPRGFLTILTPEKAPEIESDTSGRLQYAQWITRPHNPLTSRVAVNRIWMHLFGRGIVATVNNFGATGERPTHPELLDNLAIEFVENGWSVKQLIRTVMNSRVYQLAGVSNAKAEEVDPDNNLLWRMNQRRLEVEAIRDSILMASGELDLSPGKGSIVESIGDGDIGRNLRPDQ